ncbi:hypothetical protein AB0J86_18195 [Micromonospora sp. NPDC049559]|uniref:hypothetical protein n=1 Tax=Micromonospora sp. NPDC049559 TaxID=3155923 RepID=UPI003432E02E
MHVTANEESRFSVWLRVREFAVPPSMIDTATARRTTGDWAGACAAARVDVDLDLRTVSRRYGQEFATRLRADLRRLAPDLLRWHMPRTAPDGLLRPGLTVSLARYDPPDGYDPPDRYGEPGPSDPVRGDRSARPDVGGVHLVARTSPGWADAGQRISLALWDGRRRDGGDSASGRHPHPRPDRRFRLDLHRHLWDADRSGELRVRSGADRPPGARNPRLDRLVPPELGCAVDRWAAEAAILLRARRRAAGAVAVRLGARHRLVLEVPDVDAPDAAEPRITAGPGTGSDPALPLLPDAATWVPPDLALLRAGLIDADRLHPLVASALAPDHRPAEPGTREAQRGPRTVRCRGAEHRIGLVDGVLVPLDHDPAELRREELLMALSGVPLPCLRAIDEVHRHPESLVDVRARLDHGDVEGALATVEALLGPDALLRGGALRDELETAALRRVAHGLFRTGLAGLGPVAPPPEPAHRQRGRRRPGRRTTRR